MLKTLFYGLDIPRAACYHYAVAAMYSNCRTVFGLVVNIGDKRTTYAAARNLEIAEIQCSAAGGHQLDQICYSHMKREHGVRIKDPQVLRRLKEDVCAQKIGEE